MQHKDNKLLCLSMIKLVKTRYTDRGGGDKYYIDCSAYSENPDTIHIQTLIRNTKDTDVVILKAVATDETIQKKNRHIVVKISPNPNKTPEDMASKEYRIGETIHQHQLSGFIRYICLFSCFDNSSKKFEPIEPRHPPIPKVAKICKAVETTDNKKNVLVMPYIREGSVEKYNWTTDNIDLLKNLLIHTILSSATAFQKIGLIHGDFHLGNVLFKRTKITEINYAFANGQSVNVPTMGYKTVIMDFEKTDLGIIDPYLFWNDLRNLLLKVDGLKNDSNGIVNWDSNIIVFVENMRNNRKSADHVTEFVEIVNKSNLRIERLAPMPKYDPNVFF